MAISPGFIFYDRYSIHESWLVLFLIVTFWGILGISTSREPKYFWGFLLGLTGMILTKETYIIHLAAFAAAGLFALIWSRSCRREPRVNRTDRKASPFDMLLGQCWSEWSLIIFFYSGNFRNWRGLAGLYQTFLPWTKTAVDAAGHGKPDFDLFPLVPPFLGQFAGSRSIREFQTELVLDSSAAGL